WVWGGGFLASMGVLDFAGGLVVHLSAGTAGLVAAKVMGRRHGYGTENLSPFDLSLAVMGTGLLLGRLVRLQRRLGGRGQFARGARDHRDTSCRLLRRADVGCDR